MNSLSNDRNRTRAGFSPQPSLLPHLANGMAEAALRSGELIIPAFNQKRSYSVKPDRSVLTETDLAVQALLERELRALLPSAAFLGEETAPSTEAGCVELLQSQFLWVVDPIDGTNNFVSGIPLFGVSIGLLERVDQGHVPLLGVIYLPALREILYPLPSENAVARRNLETGAEERLKPRTDLGTASAFMIADALFQTHRADYSATHGYARSFGSSVSELAFTVSGRAVASICNGYLWDLAAGLALARAAGFGIFSFSTGEPVPTIAPPQLVIDERGRKWGFTDPLLVCSPEVRDAVRATFPPQR